MTATLHRAAGYSLLELMFATGLIATLTAISVPQVLAGIDGSRTYAAARYVAAQFQSARTSAAMRAAYVGIRFEPVDGSYQFTTYLDGNANGIRTIDVDMGVDQPIHPAEQLRAQFPGVDYGALPGLPAVDSSSAAPDGDPIKFGTSHIVSFSPIGAASSGSVYLLGRNGTQYVVRVLGETGRVRVLRFDPRARKWIAL